MYGISGEWEQANTHSHWWDASCSCLSSAIIVIWWTCSISHCVFHIAHPFVHCSLDRYEFHHPLIGNTNTTFGCASNNARVRGMHLNCSNAFLIRSATQVGNYLYGYSECYSSGELPIWLQCYWVYMLCNAKFPTWVALHIRNMCCHSSDANALPGSWTLLAILWVAHKLLILYTLIECNHCCKRSIEEDVYVGLCMCTLN